MRLKREVILPPNEQRQPRVALQRMERDRHQQRRRADLVLAWLFIVAPTLFMA